jgi:[ribosomal protein S5]-alanine N-acetyltransferase
MRLLLDVDEASLPSDALLRLTLFTPADAEALADLDRDPEHRRRFELPAEHVPSVAHSLAVIEAWAWARADGQRYAFAARLPTGELVGGVELYPRPQLAANLSYWVHPAQRGRGYARRAVALACAWVRDRSPIQRIEIRIEPDNLASRRVALACGFEPTGARAGLLLYVLEIKRGA